jgi:hypothetical protein
MGGAWSRGTVYRITLVEPATVIAQLGDHHGLLSENVGLDLSRPASDVTLTVTVQRTAGLKLLGPYAPSEVRTACRVDVRKIVCVFELPQGAELSAGRHDLGVRMRSAWLLHRARLDSFHLTYTSGGSTYEQTGSFQRAMGLPRD